VCCSVLQCVAVCCSVLQCVAVCCSVLQCVALLYCVLQCATVCYSALQCAAVCCVQHKAACWLIHMARNLAFEPDTLSEAVVQLRTAVTFLTWLISRTEFSSSELVL